MIGKLDRRITFIQPIIAQGTSNEDKVTGWEEIASVPDVWAEKLEKMGAVYAQADRLTYAQQTQFNIRYRSDLSMTYRIVCDTIVYVIQSIAEQKDNRKRYTNIITNVLDNTYFT